MSDQREVREVPRRYGLPEQDESGNDVEHLRNNLRLTPTERVQRMQAFMNLFMEARRAGKSRRLQDGS